MQSVSVDLYRRTYKIERTILFKNFIVFFNSMGRMKHVRRYDQPCLEPCCFRTGVS